MVRNADMKMARESVSSASARADAGRSAERR